MLKRLHLLFALVLVASTAVADGIKKWQFELAAGAAWQNRNDVRIPGNAGTRFSLQDLAGNGPYPSARFEAFYHLGGPHGLRLMLAPFEYTETGILPNDVFFVDKTFLAGGDIEAKYKFNSYRFTYRYKFYVSDHWQWHVGGTLKVRDAEIALAQGQQFANDTDIGVVPLLYLYGDYKINKKWNFVFDMDGLASPQGRAFDLGLKLSYDITDQWYFGGSYRILEGGADNDTVYNFAWFNYLLVSVGYRN
ncbi:hypothetical protein [Kaarinaea lacus]